MSASQCIPSVGFPSDEGTCSLRCYRDLSGVLTVFPLDAALRAGLKVQHLLVRMIRMRCSLAMPLIIQFVSWIYHTAIYEGLSTP